MVVADIKLTNGNVNSGTAVELGGAKVRYVWKNITENNATPLKYDIAAASYAGFEPPTIVITGTIPIDESITNHMSQKLLVDFATVRTGDTTLSVTAGKTGGTTLGGRPSAGYVATGSNTLTTSLKVQVLTFTINFSASETIEGSGWTYTISMVETT
jgi:hypothetical protein